MMLALTRLGSTTYLELDTTAAREDSLVKCAGDSLRVEAKDALRSESWI
jgi:hypothetical protein